MFNRKEVEATIERAKAITYAVVGFSIGTAATTGLGWVVYHYFKSFI